MKIQKFHFPMQLTYNARPFSAFFLPAQQNLLHTHNFFTAPSRPKNATIPRGLFGRPFSAMAAYSGSAVRFHSDVVTLGGAGAGEEEGEGEGGAREGEGEGEAGEGEAPGGGEEGGEEGGARGPAAPSPAGGRPTARAAHRRSDMRVYRCAPGIGFFSRSCRACCSISLCFSVGVLLLKRRGPSAGGGGGFSHSHFPACSVFPDSNLPGQV